MKEKIIEILKKHHLHHYGNFEEAVEELDILFKNKKSTKSTKPKIDKSKCAHNFQLKRGIFRCIICNQTLGQWLLTDNPVQNEIYEIIKEK
jgi:hypothetical protein